MTQSLMIDLDTRFRTTSQSVRYISADEMAYLQARARSLRAAASREIFDAVRVAVAGLFRSRRASIAWQAPAGVVTAK